MLYKSVECSGVRGVLSFSFDRGFATGDTEAGLADVIAISGVDFSAKVLDAQASLLPARRNERPRPRFWLPSFNTGGAIAGVVGSSIR